MVPLSGKYPNLCADVPTRRAASSVPSTHDRYADDVPAGTAQRHQVVQHHRPRLHTRRSGRDSFHSSPSAMRRMRPWASLAHAFCAASSHSSHRSLRLRHQTVHDARDGQSGLRPTGHATCGESLSEASYAAESAKGCRLLPARLGPGTARWDSAHGKADAFARGRCGGTRIDQRSVAGARRACLIAEACRRTVRCLDCLVWADLETDDNRMSLSKRACGIPLQESLPDTGTNVLSVQAHIDGVLLSDWPWPLHIGSLPRLERPLDTRWSETPHVH